jgi:Mycoplasma protein of unknown function, DUF285/Secretion system C-terminal sorting domain
MQQKKYLIIVNSAYIYYMKKIIFLLLLQIKCFCSLAQPPMITVWDLSKTGGPDSILNLPMCFSIFQQFYSFNYTWESIPAGTTGSGFFSNGCSKYIYGIPQNATIKLSIYSYNNNYITFNSGIDKLRLVDIQQWGNEPFDGNFMGYNNLNISATDTPSFLNGNLKDLFAMDSGINVFTGPANINSWDVSGVTDMSGMFKNCHLFNRPLSNWNMANVKNTAAMFENASSFNQPLDSWDTHNDTNMQAMFKGATAFNQPLANWNTNYVKNKNAMFANATSFNQSLGSWPIHPILNMDNMLDSCGMDCSNYSSTLYGWATQTNMPNNKTLGAAGLQFGNNAQASRDTLSIAKGWNILGDSASIDTCCFAKTFTHIACDSFYFNEQTLTTSGTYYDTIANTYGCDTIITLHLTVNYSSSHNIFVTKCSSYNFVYINNNNQYFSQILSASGIYPYYFINAKGCDSILYLNLTINTIYRDTFDIELCKYIIFNNNAILASGYYKDTFTAVSGCDSFVTIHVTQKFPSFSSFFASACEGMMHGDTFRTKSGLYNAKYTNAVGCDSTRQLSLIVHSPGKDTVQQSGNTLSSKYINAIYQWVNCNSFTPIIGATAKSFSPTANGFYAVITSLSFCKDTSNCVAVNGVGITDEFVTDFTISPNPASHQILLTANTFFDNATIKIHNTMGQLLYTAQHINGNEKNIDVANYAKGLYMLQVNDKNKRSIVKFVKE